MGKQRQRRRKQKERRHEYEYVYLDEQGEEVAVEEVPKKSAERTNSSGRTPAAKGGKAPQPPSFRSVGKQALFFFAILAVSISIFSGGSTMPVYGRLLLAAGYTIVFLPGIYFMARFKYRTYLKQTGQLPPKPAKPKAE